MINAYTDEEVRVLLAQDAKRKGSHTTAEEIGITPSQLSQIVNGHRPIHPLVVHHYRLMAVKVFIPMTPKPS